MWRVVVWVVDGVEVGCLIWVERVRITMAWLKAIFDT